MALYGRSDTVKLFGFIDRSGFDILARILETSEVERRYVRKPLQAALISRSKSAEEKSVYASDPLM